MKFNLANTVTSFWKTYSAQWIMIRKWEGAWDVNMNKGLIFMEYQKSFETLNHIFLLVKHKAYGLQPDELNNKGGLFSG